MNKATLIVAQDSSRGIGSKGKLPWRLSKEMKYFAQATTAAPEGQQNAVLMGRTTWESIPAKFRPLKERVNIVLSSKSAEDLNLPEGVLQASSLPEAMSLLSQNHTLRVPVHRAFVIGGAQLYKASLEEVADRILLTQITQGDDQWECDTFFPKLDHTLWKKVTPEEHQTWLQGVEFSPNGDTEKGISWQYELWIKR